MGITHSTSILTTCALFSTVHAQEVVASDFASDLFRKVTAPEDGEEIYMYIVAVIIGTLVYFLHEKW
jgi:hypothetical protein